MKPIDTSDLPPELLAELRDTKAGQLSRTIVKVVDEHEEGIDVNGILVGVYRKLGAVHRRVTISNTLTRLVRSNRVVRVSANTYATPRNVVQKGLYND